MTTINIVRLLWISTNERDTQFFFCLYYAQQGIKEIDFQWIFKMARASFRNESFY